jgi:hypothetical protein
VNNATKILSALDSKLNRAVELTLFGRAAFVLSYPNAPKEFAASRDIDAVLWIGQAEELAQTTNFWEAVEEVNQQFRDQEIFISHLFEENQVVLTPKWKTRRVPIHRSWRKLMLFRLGDADLFLSKLMRFDPQDLADARFAVDQAGWNEDELSEIVASARIPNVPELREQFAFCAAEFLQRNSGSRNRVILNSAAIAAVTYERPKRTLDVEFRGGGTYRYFNVPLPLYRDLLKAESAGAFWNEVKGDLTYARLK